MKLIKRDMKTFWIPWCDQFYSEGWSSSPTTMRVIDNMDDIVSIYHEETERVRTVAISARDEVKSSIQEIESGDKCV